MNLSVITYLCEHNRNKMKNRQEVLLFNELLDLATRENLVNYEITCFKLSEVDFTPYHFLPLYVNAYVYLLIESGYCQVLVNYRKYDVDPLSILVLSPLHLLQFCRVSSDINCYVLMLNKPFLDIIPSMEKVFKHLNRSLKLYNNPIMKMDSNEHDLLVKCIRKVRHRILQTNHVLQKEIIQNAFITFLLEWINIFERYMQQHLSEVDLNRSEQILQSFISLLKENFKSEHHVRFYAEMLHITPQYLTLIVKQLTGQTINQFIYEMLYNEATILLNRSDLSIQQISDNLHFSDPSAFCKFFKRRSGKSPLKYRKG